MTLRAVHPVLMASDVDASVAFYVRIGFVCPFRSTAGVPYAVVVRDAVELHLQWHDHAGWAVDADRPVYRILVDDVDALATELAAAGVDARGPWDTAWGTREVHVHDPDRNGLQFYRGR